MSRNRDVYNEDRDVGTFRNITWNMPAASHSDSEKFHSNDIVLALNTQTGKKELGKVRWTEPQYKSARIIFNPKEYKNGHIVHMSADIPYSDLEMHEKYKYAPNASIVDLLRSPYDE